MKQQYLTVRSVTEIQKNIYKMKLSGNCTEISAPGQFINIRLAGFYLRRPISIASWDAASLTIVFRTVGAGTEALSRVEPGTSLDVLMPLGNGFDLTKGGNSPLLIGGGIGLPPVYGLARAMVQEGMTPRVIAGFNTKNDVILTKDFNFLGIEPVITTMDGSEGLRGTVTDAAANADTGYVYACGPEPMLKAVYDICGDGQFSFEARMACGFGACMGCSCKTKYGYKRICKDGPVLQKEEIIW